MRREEKLSGVKKDAAAAKILCKGTISVTRAHRREAIGEHPKHSFLRLPSGETGRRGASLS